MSRFKKILFLVLSVFMLVGCFGNMTPSEQVENTLNKYVKNDRDLLEELDTYMAEQDLNEEQRKRYKEIIKDEYANLKYDIKNEEIDGDEASVEVEIEVKDLYKASKEAEDYLIDNAEEFYTNDIYDESKFVDYKLDVMEKAKDTVEYTIFFELTKNDGKWSIDDIDDETLEKIHGIYNYEND